MIHCGEALTLTDGLVLTGPNKDISLSLISDNKMPALC